MRLLVVCTGNVCRSPLAAALFSARLGPDWQVESAGTAALVGRPMTPPTVDLARAGGVDHVAHEARQLTQPLAESADLILTAGRAHRRQVVELAPKVVRRTFTLREFARLAPGAARASAQASPSLGDLLAATAEQRRHWVGAVEPADDEIVDPFGAPEPVYAEAGRAIEDAVRSAVWVLRLASSPRESITAE